MEKAKEAIAKFTSNQGHHTTVEETVNPAITRETVKPHRHEETTQAIDREVHRHHYHTTALPLTHTERLPEKHTHNILPTEHREYRHEDEERTKHKISADLAQFKDHSQTHEVRHTKAAAPTVTGEHVHHHVHETVVPIIHKETVQPEVVHTTVPIHETHHAAAEHHGLSALPMKTLDEFKQAGGVLTGGKHTTHEEYEGAPRQYNDKLSTTLEKLGLGGGTSTSTTTGTSSHSRHADSGVGGVGEDFSRGERGVEGMRDNTTKHGLRDASDRHTNTSSTTGSSAIAGTGNNFRDNTTTSGVGDVSNKHSHGLGSTGTTGTTGTGNTFRDNTTTSGLGNVSNKHSNGLGSTGTTGIGSTGTGTTGGIRGDSRNHPTTGDRLNPRTDADRDGKAGVLD